jgi:hypothetical protein
MTVRIAMAGSHGVAGIAARSLVASRLRLPVSGPAAIPLATFGGAAAQTSITPLDIGPPSGWAGRWDRRQAWARLEVSEPRHTRGGGDIIELQLLKEISCKDVENMLLWMNESYLYTSMS